MASLVLLLKHPSFFDRNIHFQTKDGEAYRLLQFAKFMTSLYNFLEENSIKWGFVKFLGKLENLRHLQYI